MNKPVYGGHRHAGVREDVMPARERLIGRYYEKTFALVPFSYQFEQHAGFSLVLSDVRQIIQDDQIEAVEFGKCRRQLQTLSRNLELLHQVTDARA